MGRVDRGTVHRKNAVWVGSDPEEKFVEDAKKEADERPDPLEPDVLPESEHLVRLEEEVEGYQFFGKE